MKRLITFLSNHYLLSIVIALLFYLLSVLPHETVGDILSRHLDQPLGRTNYNLLISSIFMSFATIFLVWFYCQAKKIPKKEYLFIFSLLILNVFLILISINVIFVVQIEIVHIVQYTLMSILVFPIVKNYRECMFWTFMLGVLDELYQYIVLAPNKNDYFDFNDVIINLLGVFFGLVIIRIAGVKESKTYSNPLYRPSNVVAVLILFIIFISNSLGFISIKPVIDNSQTVIFEFIKDFKPGFWTKLPRSGNFHIVRPIEGIVIIIGLMYLFNVIAKKFNSES